MWCTLSLAKVQNSLLFYNQGEIQIGLEIIESILIFKFGGHHWWPEIMTILMI